MPALASFSPDHPDAELLRLGVQLEIVGREVKAEDELAANNSYDEEEDENGDTKMDRLQARLRPIINEIVALQPTTLDGLRVQARALALRAPDLWDTEQEAEQDFIGAVFGLLGVGQNGKPITA
ncbi:MAG: hypothetical protein WAK55_25960 [Xanthobacteraceae bacterium]